MFTHTGLWSAIDNLAESLGTSTSGLAKRAGLDATSFNKSKRIGPDGKPRWPSTESIARVLAAANMTLTEFLLFMPENEISSGTAIPLITNKDATKKNIFDADGFPAATKSELIEFPNFDLSDVYALELIDDTYAPLYPAGCTLILSPTAPVRRGDKVAIKTKTAFMLADFMRKTSNKVDILAVGTQKSMQVALDDVIFITRILWASQ